MNYTNPISDRAQQFAKHFDAAADRKDTKEVSELIGIAKAVADEEDALSQAYIFYCIGNMYSLFPIQLCGSKEKSTENVLYYYRKSITEIEKEDYSEPSFSPYIKPFKGLLYTNYANELDRCGRKIAAIEQYRKAVIEYPKLGMALGNIGIAYQHYGALEYDNGHRDYFHYFAYQYLKMGANSDDLNTTSTAKQAFEDSMKLYSQEYVEKVLEPNLNIPQFTYDDPEELEYRQWCLSHRLFLNTLNDLPISELCFAADVLRLPDMMVDQYETPVFHGMFASLKQEYIYARYLYYEASEPGIMPIFADRETCIESYTDFASYSIRLEKLKTAFKTLYGLFDKIAFFLAHYFDIGFQLLQHINARTVWKIHIGSKKSGYNLKNPLDYSNNVALSALYWICKDFFYVEESDNSPNPELKRIADIRNFLEHRYVKIYNDILCNDIRDFKDELAEYISEEELCRMTMTLLKVLREAIISLSLCVKIAEQPKQISAKDHLVIPLSLMNYDDEWKI